MTVCLQQLRLMMEKVELAGSPGSETPQPDPSLSGVAGFSHQSVRIEEDPWMKV